MATTEHIRATICPYCKGEILVKELHHRFDQGDEIEVTNQVCVEPCDGFMEVLRAQGRE